MAIETPIFTSSGYVPRSRIAGSYGNFVLVFGLSLWSDVADVTPVSALSFAGLSKLQSLKKPTACAVTVLRATPDLGSHGGEAAVILFLLSSHNPHPAL